MVKLNYFILSYNKPSCIPTLQLLHKYGIYDDVYIVVGDDDPKLSEYLQLDNVLVFDKRSVADKVDSIGSYSKTLKLCTYARVFIDDYARSHNLQYVCVLFDDIQSVALRFMENGVTRNIKRFDLRKVLEYYTELLSCNEHIYMTGPPSSSYYMGCSRGVNSNNRVCSHYANILIYDVNRPIGPYKASVLEDMWIVLSNALIGHIGLFPFGLQVNCRPSKVTNDAYENITNLEHLAQYILLTGKLSSNMRNIIIPYNKFIPKIISGGYKK